MISMKRLSPSLAVILVALLRGVVGPPVDGSGPNSAPTFVDFNQVAALLNQKGPSQGAGDAGTAPKGNKVPDKAYPGQPPVKPFPPGTVPPNKPGIFKPTAVPTDFEVNAAANCKEFELTSVTTLDQCLKVFMPDLQTSSNGDAVGILSPKGFCRWDASRVTSRGIGACFCPRSKSMCKDSDRCYWYSDPIAPGNSECISNAERFYNILNKLLLQRGKKDFAIRINYSSAPAQGNLPFGPFGPAIINSASTGLGGPSYPDTYSSLFGQYPFGPAAGLPYQGPYGYGAGPFGQAGPYGYGASPFGQAGPFGPAPPSPYGPVGPYGSGPFAPGASPLSPGALPYPSPY